MGYASGMTKQGSIADTIQWCFSASVILGWRYLQIKLCWMKHNCTKF